MLVKNLFELITTFLHRLGIYLKLPPMEGMSEVVVNVIVELLFTLAVVVKQMRQGLLSESLLSDVSLD
jgi:hypothetical protein